MRKHKEVENKKEKQTLSFSSCSLSVH
jgi:hypothetical protein